MSSSALLKEKCRGAAGNWKSRADRCSAGIERPGPPPDKTLGTQLLTQLFSFRPDTRRAQAHSGMEAMLPHWDEGEVPHMCGLSEGGAVGEQGSLGSCLGWQHKS